MTSTALKLLALLLMFCDHIGEFIPGAPIWLHWIGRLSAPIFLFCMVWGLQYTHSRKTYLLRMYAFGVGMGILDLLFNLLWIGDPYQYITNNIFVTLLLVGMLVGIIETLRRDPKKGIRYLIGFVLLQMIGTAAAILPMLNFGNSNMVSSSWVSAALTMGAIFPNIIFNEGSIFFVALGVLMYFAKENKAKLSAVYLAFCAMEFVSACTGGWSTENLLMLNYQWMMAGALPFMLLYNGEKGHGYKYLFYVFYPVHIFLLFIIGNLFVR